MTESKFSTVVKKADLFAQNIEILLQNGRSKLQTHCGLIFGITMIVIMLLFGSMKLIVMAEFKDNTIQEPIKLNHFPFTYVYDDRDGFHIAFGLTAYDSSSDPTPFDATFGEIAAYQKVWGEKDAQGNNLPTSMRKLRSSPCQAQDLNLNNDPNVEKYRFFPPDTEYEYETRRFQDVLQCIQDDVILKGDYNTAAASQLVIAFTICRNEPGVPILPGDVICRDEAFIKKWMRRKWILILEN